MAASAQPTTSTIPAYKTAYLQSCLSANVLTFGTYTLKSGRRTSLHLSNLIVPPQYSLCNCED